MTDGVRPDEPAGTGFSNPWRGRWIWAAGDPDHPGSARSVVAMRCPLQVDVVPDTVPARIIAVARYALFVNGRQVARGPMRANPLQQPYDVLDLARHLRTGENMIGIVAWNYRQAMPWWLPPAGPHTDLREGGVAFEAQVDHDSVVSDRRWIGTSLPAWSMTTPEGLAARGVERVDARDLPDGWADPDTDVGWPVVVERHPVVPGARPRPTPPTYPVGPHGPRQVTWPVSRPVSLEPRGGGEWVTDQVVAGTVRVTVDGPPGATASVQVSERVDAEGHPTPGSYDSAFEVVCDGTRRRLETLDAYGLTGLQVTADDTVEVVAVEVVERLHPVSGQAGFRCSDPRLDAIWAVGRRTVSLCSWDAYIDCPTREQRAWTGDAVVHQMVDLATNDDWTLARWHPLMSARPRPDGMLPMAVAGDLEEPGRVVIADWALHWIHSVWNLYRYVGDRAEVAELLPVAEGVLRWFARSCDAEGLPTDVPGGVLIDWASVYTDGTSTALCGLWGRALREFAAMAAWVGDKGRARWARDRHAALVAGMEALWDPERGRYADVLRDGVRAPMASQHAQAAAIVGDVVPVERLPRLVEVMTDGDRLVDAAFSAPDGPALPGSEVEVGGQFLFDGPPAPWWDVSEQVVRAQPFFRYVVHDALAQAGRADLVGQACLDWTDALDRCPTTWTETWYGGTTCHAWSSTPTRDLMTYVLGIQPAEPGFTSARIEPALGHLAWAEGTCPTPFGPLRVRVDDREMTVDSPVPFAHGGTRFPAGAHTLAGDR